MKVMLYMTDILIICKVSNEISTINHFEMVGLRLSVNGTRAIEIGEYCLSL